MFAAGADVLEMRIVLSHPAGSAVRTTPLVDIEVHSSQKGRTLDLLVLKSHVRSKDSMVPLPATNVVRKQGEPACFE